jgi:hypothetical protein
VLFRSDEIDKAVGSVVNGVRSKMVPNDHKE